MGMNVIDTFKTYPRTVTEIFLKVMMTATVVERSLNMLIAFNFFVFVF